mmetsp:Transcript_50673/g.74095  ORF Transcript_50673/g.74095 Transcript_50673/m.74095 type:complete len:220 (+) Transcript_50673:26-685(+)
MGCSSSKQIARQEYELFHAALAGDITKCRQILKLGADPNWVNCQEPQFHSGNCLHAAAAGGHPELCRLMIAQKVSVMAKDQRGATPLHWACMTVQPAAAALLLEAGAHANEEDNMGCTPLDVIGEGTGELESRDGALGMVKTSIDPASIEQLRDILMLDLFEEEDALDIQGINASIDTGVVLGRKDTPPAAEDQKVVTDLQLRLWALKREAPKHQSAPR